MKKIYVPMIRYGDKDFDEGFIGWGFQSYDDQIKTAKGVLRIASGAHMKILDVACGLGTYHRPWLEAGHSVTGIDLSETFIFMAQNTNESFKRASYRVENYELLDEDEVYDLVTLIDTPLEDNYLCENIFKALKPGGAFVFQIANPAYPHPLGPLHQNYRDWGENEDRTLSLTRHEYNPEIERWEYEKWHVDIEQHEIVVEHHFSKNLDFNGVSKLLLEAGFILVNFVDNLGVPHTMTEENPKNFLGVAFKPHREGYVPETPEESGAAEAASGPAFGDNGPMFGDNGPLFDDNGPLFDDNGPIVR